MLKEPKTRKVTIEITAEDGGDEVNMTMEFDRDPEGEAALENQAIKTAMIFLKFFNDRYNVVEDAEELRGKR